jgi:transposase
MPQHSTDIKNQFKILLDLKLSRKDIISKLNISERTYYYWKSKYEKTGKIEKKKIPGRPRSTTASQDETVIQVLKKNPYSSNDAKKSLFQEEKIDISSRTIIRRAKEVGMKFRKSTVAPSLTENQVKKRLIFANDNSNTDWKKYIFTDEKLWCVEKPQSKKWCIVNEKYVSPRKKFPKKVMCWAGIGYDYKLDIYIFEDKVNQETYRNMLDSHFLPFYRERSAYGSLVLYQDGATSHTGSKTKEFLGRKRIKYVTGPPNSPDLNPIENMWAILSDKMKRHECDTVENFIRALKEEWEKISQSQIKNLVNSMNDRIEMVKKK